MLELVAKELIVTVRYPARRVTLVLELYSARMSIDIAERTLQITISTVSMLGFLVRELVEECYAQRERGCCWCCRAR